MPGQLNTLFAPLQRPPPTSTFSKPPKVNVIGIMVIVCNIKTCLKPITAIVLSMRLGNIRNEQANIIRVFRAGKRYFSFNELKDVEKEFSFQLFHHLHKKPRKKTRGKIKAWPLLLFIFLREMGEWTREIGVVKGWNMCRKTYIIAKLMLLYRPPAQIISFLFKFWVDSNDLLHAFLAFRPKEWVQKEPNVIIYIPCFFLRCQLRSPPQKKNSLLPFFIMCPEMLVLLLQVVLLGNRWLLLPCKVFILFYQLFFSLLFVLL